MTGPAPLPGPLSIDDAQARIAAHISVLSPEQVPLGQAHGRFLAEDLRAAIDLPSFANSAMDGYALRAADTPGRLRVVGESAAGAPYVGALQAGEAIVISTGAVVPEQADAVVPIEDVSADDGAECEVNLSVAPGACIRLRGSDVKRGDRLMLAGTRLGPAQIGAAAAAGQDSLACRSRPSVALLTTGSELRQPGEELGEGEIFDSNRPMLTAALSMSGAIVTQIPAIDDTAQAHRAALARAVNHDVAISSGGVSMGAHDLVRGIGREIGIREVFWRVAMRPGKPLAFGVRDKTLVFGLPGNPVSALVCFELFVRPALAALQGAARAQPEWQRGSLGLAVARNARRDELIRVRVTAGTTPVLEPLPGQQSHQISLTAQADGLARIPAGRGELPAGSQVAYLMLNGT